MSRRVLITTMTACFCWCIVGPLQAQIDWGRTPVQLALWHPVQLFEDHVDVVGVRLGIYGMNANVTGADFQLASRTLGNQTGLQLGPYNKVDGSMRGWQIGIVNQIGGDHGGLQAGFFNTVAGDMTGLQIGPMNLTLAYMNGLQLGVINYAKDVTGLQVGVFNAAQIMYGIQIGVINIISDKDALPIMPFFNAVF